jgi:hypothetical protein
MSNIAGKAYAINLITPIRAVMVPLDRLMFWVARQPVLQRGLRDRVPALSKIHFARWLILRDRDLPHLTVEQPKERLRHSYLVVLGSLNANLEQCVDHFAATFPNAFRWLCFGAPGWPKSRLRALQQNISRNQVWTDYFYSAYPLATVDALRSAERVKREVCAFIQRTEDTAPAEFMREYHGLLKTLQGDLGLLSTRPMPGMAARDQAAYVAPDMRADTDVYRSALQAAAEPRAASQRVRRAQ